MDEVVTVLVTLKEAGDPGNVGGGGVGAEMEPSHSAGLGGFPVTPAGVGGVCFVILGEESLETGVTLCILERQRGRRVS